jgi:hypothetical protein
MEKVRLMDPRRERRVRNEAIFREVNERIEELDSHFGHVAPDPSRLIVVCECGLGTCAGQFEVTRPEYEAVRANPKRFLVLPGHEDQRIERLIEQHADFSVVEKFHHEADVAVEHDPRS